MDEYHADAIGDFIARRRLGGRGFAFWFRRSRVSCGRHGHFRLNGWSLISLVVGYSRKGGFALLFLQSLLHGGFFFPRKDGRSRSDLTFLFLCSSLSFSLQPGGGLNIGFQLRCSR